MTGRDAGRGQLVLVAAVVAALALVPVVAAYLQFGYAPAVADVDDRHDERVSRTLERITTAPPKSRLATPGATASKPWGNSSGCSRRNSTRWRRRACATASS
ncbi:hypothetical protein GRX66_18670 [Halobacterium sp. PCN9]|uniref:Uncharacterized protein n=1 Tax=Halobacterium bonnevillei TaxID=2692200 RepID=A0A6B0SSH0_9EURY|nr:hypothetical protein [Halobacterium bonnevillei]MXR22503.1 hypothetical protein [Halobacterium bonnevillei]